MLTTGTLWFVIWCYTATGYTQCLKQDNLPDAAACNTVFNTIKAKRPVARLEQCASYPAALPATSTASAPAGTCKPLTAC